MTFISFYGSLLKKYLDEEAKLFFTSKINLLFCKFKKLNWSTQTKIFLYLFFKRNEWLVIIRDIDINWLLEPIFKNESH